MKKESGVLEGFIADISMAVETFSEQEAASKRMLDQLSVADPAKFFAAGIHLVASTKPCDGSRYLVVLLAKDKRLTNWLLDPRACTFRQATTVARATADARVQLQSVFEMALNKALQQQANAANTDRVLRILNLLEALETQSCWNSFQVELMAYPDKIVRSKAALLIGRSRKNTAWIARRLLDRDPRVQANAVETLWGVDPAEAKPHLSDALKSKNNRVFANAALGLYRFGDPKMIQVLLEATKHPDPLFQASALWAIGQTQDPRFLPALSLQFKSAEGKHRLAIGGAISRIRQREKSGAGASALQLDISQASIQSGGKRRLLVTLSGHPAKVLNGLKATEFLIWENEIQVQEYQVRPIAPPDPLVAGFVAPWFESASDPMELAVREALNQCLSMKRANDHWRIDRYSVAPPSDATPEDAKANDDSRAPYDDSAITAQLKTAYGCVAEADVLRKIIDLAVPHDRAATDGFSAIQRQYRAIGQRNGKRHMFVLLHEAGSDLQQEASAVILGGLSKDKAVVFHGIALGAPGQWPLFRDVCLSNSEGSFIETSEAGIMDGFVRAYATLCNKFEISYSPSASGAEATGQLALKVKVASNNGSGQGEIIFDGPAAQPAPAPAGEQATTAEAAASPSQAQPSAA